MNFLKKAVDDTHNMINIDDYIDHKIIEALPLSYQRQLIKLLNTRSPHLDKFFKKLSSNQMNLNHDLLFRILDNLNLQMTLPLKIICLRTQEDLYQSFLNSPTISPSIELTTWFDLQTKLGIWPQHLHQNIQVYLNLAHAYIVNDQEPHFQEQEKQLYSKKFWQKKTFTENLSMEIIFKFIYEKLKFFHWDLLPHTKRPIDLFELFCPVEDAALETKLISYNEEQITFLRSLNAAALIYSTIFSFSPAIPDLTGHYISAQTQQRPDSFWVHFMEHPQYQALYGQHPHLQSINLYGLQFGLLFIFKFLRTQTRFKNLSDYQILQTMAQTPELQNHLHEFLQNLSYRLIFIFNRLTSLGFLLRSPLLKGLGYHPLINTEVPIKLFKNFELFIELMPHYPAEQQISILNHLQHHEAYSIAQSPIITKVPSF